MSLPRKDVRFYLDHDMHSALLAICNQRGINVSDYVEALVVADVHSVAHAAIELADALKVLRYVPEEAGVAMQHIPEAERIRQGLPPGAKR